MTPTQNAKMDTSFATNASLPAMELIESYCISSKSEDPLELALTVMRNPKVKMHGPEHHFLVPACLLAAYYNIKKDYKEKATKIRMAKNKKETCQI